MEYRKCDHHTTHFLRYNSIKQTGDFHHPATLYRIVDIAAGNLQRYMAGDGLMNVVDMETGYKS